MSYEIEDVHGNRLLVEPSNIETLVRVTAISENGQAAIVTPQAEDAPAVAMAFLEEAGVESIDPTTVNASATPERVALYWLYQWQGLRKVQTQREAEDARVLEWRSAMIASRGTVGTVTPWEDLDEWMRNEIRSDFRTAREFFTREGTP